MITAQCCRQFRAGQRGVCGQLDGGWLVLKRSILIEQLIDPKGEIECSAIKIVLLECFG